MINNSLKSQTAFDYDLKGGFDSNGEIKQLWGQDALSNSIKMWLASYRGDILRDPTKGGVAINYISKPMSDMMANRFRGDIISGLQEEFSPALSSVEVSVTPNYANRYWLIYIKAWSSFIKDTIEVSAKIKNLI